MSSRFKDGGEKDIYTINAAKRRLLELELDERTAYELEKKIEGESHFTSRHSIFMLIGEIVIVFGTLVEVCYYLIRDEPLSIISFLSILTTVGLAGFLVWRLDGLRRVKANRETLQALRHKIEREQAEVEQIID